MRPQPVTTVTLTLRVPTGRGLTAHRPRGKNGLTPYIEVSRQADIVARACGSRVAVCPGQREHGAARSVTHSWHLSVNVVSVMVNHW